MADWVADRAGTKLVAQINEIAPNRRKDSDGTIGDPDHQSRDSAHNPEDSSDADAPGNPDDQVDAFDVTHDPANGCDIGVFWEQIRASKDRRAKFAIFNRRCFSNYAVAGHEAFTWRPYSGSNPHDRHGHIEIDDRYHDQTHDWKISMALSEQEAYILHVINYRVAALLHLDPRAKVPAVGSRPALDTENRLATALSALGGGIAQVRAAIDTLPDGELDPTEIDAIADSLAAKLPAQQATQLAQALTLRFQATA